MNKGAFLLPHPPILLPEIGQGTEEQSQNIIDAMHKVGEKIKALQPETIIVITPHGPVFDDGIVIGYDNFLVGNLDKFGYKDISTIKSNHNELVDRIIYESGKIDVPCLKLNDDNADYFKIEKTLDHGVVVPLTFIDEHYDTYRLVHITYGLFNSVKLYEFGMVLNRCLDLLDINAVIVASGDLSHCLKDEGPYEYHPSGEKFDKAIRAALLSKQPEKTMFMDEQLLVEAQQCGKRSIDIMLGCLDGYDYHAEELAYNNPFGVGYSVMAFEDLKQSDQRHFYTQLIEEHVKQQSDKQSNESRFVGLARRAIENMLGLRDDVMDDTLTPEMLETTAGTFVSIKKNGALRGCMGTIGPTEDNIALEIVSNALKAAFEDPRFPSVIKEEMDSLAISVDVLMTPEPVESKELLNPNHYGLIVTQGYKRGLLLPNLESIDTVDEQIRIACQKGSIDVEKPFEMERFEVVRYY